MRWLAVLIMMWSVVLAQRAPRVVDDFAGLLALPASQTQPDVLVIGSGGGVFRWVAGSSLATNAVDVIAVPQGAATGRYVRQPDSGGRVVDAVADLLALNPDSGQLASTRGYWIPGDGGHGQYRWTNALPAGVVTNNGTWFAGAFGFWSLIHDGRINVRQVGAKGDGVTDDSGVMQTLLDIAPDGGQVLISPGTYSLGNGIIIRRHNLTLSGFGATLQAANDLGYGTLVGVANATNVIVEGVTLDVAEQYDNGLTVIGNTSEFDGYLSELVGTNYCAGVVIDSVRVTRARFGINLNEGLGVTGTPAFTPGERVRLNNNEKYLTALVLSNDVPNSVVWVQYDIDRFPMGSSFEGITSGDVQTFTSRSNIVQTFTSGSFDSTRGPYGGKGLSIQYGTRSVTVSNCQVDDCDTGITVEGKLEAGGENSGTVITGCVIRNSGRTGMWLVAAGAPQDSAETASVVISGVRIQNWGHTWGGFGAITSDRMQFARISSVLATQDPDYVPQTPAVAWVGTASNSHIDMTVQVEEAAGLFDFRRHPIWGDLPGFLVDGSENNTITVKWIGSSVAPIEGWSNSAGTFGITNYAFNWESASASALKNSTVTAYVNGWGNELWFGKFSSNVRYFITDQASNSIVALGDASSAVTFDPTYRVSYNGTGTAPGRSAVKFNDVVEANALYKWGNNQGEIGWDHVNSRGYLRPRSGTFRVQNTAGEEILQLGSRGITTPSAAFNGKTLLIGAWQLWVDPVTSGLRMKNTTPSSATDGPYVVPLRSGTATLVAGTVTVADTQITANSVIIPARQVPGGTLGFIGVPSRVLGVSFTITSSSATDTSTVGYMILEP